MAAKIRCEKCGIVKGPVDAAREDMDETCVSPRGRRVTHRWGKVVV